MFSLSIQSTSAILAGFTTWAWLNRHNVRGDRALVFYVLLFCTTWIGLGFTQEIALSQAFRQTIALATTYVCSLLTVTVGYRLSPWHPLAPFPGPILWRISSLWLSAVSLGGHRHIVVDGLHKKYGPFVRIGPNHLSVHSPGASTALYSSNTMDKADSYNPPGRVPGVSLFFKHFKHEHVTRKRIWSNGFTSAAYSQYYYPMDRRIWQLIQCLQDRSEATGFVDLGEALAHWSYDFMGEMMFGGCNEIELLRDGDPLNLVNGGKQAMVIVDSIGQSPWLLDILWHLPASKDLHQLRYASERMMKKRISTKVTDIQDVSSYLLEGDPTTGDFIPENELAIDALVGVQAGSDNTATLLGLAFYFLLANRHSYLKLRSAIDSANPNPKDALDLEVLADIPYLNAVINETLRLMTPFFLPRVTPPSGIVIDGVDVPGGTVVALAAYTQQTCPENFGSDSLMFRPERWLEDAQVQINKAALVSFSKGRFVCVAKTFAMHELRFVLARLMLNLDMELKPGFDVDRFRERIINMRTTFFGDPLLVSVKPRSVA